jgi:hypothetical protein
MKRVFIFLIAGPLAVALIASLVFVAAGAHGPVVQYLAGALFLMTLPVAALAGTIDGFASSLPIVPRAWVTAVIGASAAGAIAFGALRCFFVPAELMYFAFGGAVCMGLCSLLANDWRRSAVPAGV